MRWFDSVSSILLILCVSTCALSAIVKEDNGNGELTKNEQSDIDQASDGKSTLNEEINEHRQKISAGLTAVVALKSSAKEIKSSNSSDSQTGLRRRIAQNGNSKKVVSVGTQSGDLDAVSNNDTDAAAQTYNSHSASDVDYPSNSDNGSDNTVGESMSTTASVWEEDTTNLQLTTRRYRPGVKQPFHDFLSTRIGGIFMVSLVVIVLFIIVSLVPLSIGLQYHVF